MRRARTLLAGLAVASGIGLAGTAASANVRPLPHASVGTIVIGSTNFTEQFIVANLYGDVLQHAGFKVQVRSDLGSRQEVLPALESGALDLEPDYAGTLLLFLNPKAGSSANNLSTAIPSLKRAFASQGTTVLDPAKAIDTN